MPKHSMRHDRPNLAVVVIARNEAACIERCLRSAKPFVDRMIVLDTGSTDDTVAIAKACGAEVGHFTWVNDFSAARNAALDLADANWNLVLDADEWIETGAEALSRICAQPPTIGVVCVKSRSDDIDGPMLQSSTWIPRLLPRGVRYQGRIHEQPVSALEGARIPLVFGHDGYLNAKLAKKRDRNTTLLLAELADRPDDPYVLYQLGKDTEIHQKDSAKARDYYLRAFDLAPQGVPYRHDLCMRLLFCLSKSGRLEEAIVRAGEWMNAWSESPDFFYMLGLLMLDSAAEHPAQAPEQWLPMAERAFLRCLEIGDRPELNDSVAGTGSHFAAENLRRIYRAQSQHLAHKANQYFSLANQLKAGTAAATR